MVNAAVLGYYTQTGPTCSGAERAGCGPISHRGYIVKPGSDLLSHAVTSIVPSALEGLTTLFGMGRGVAPPVKPPGKTGNVKEKKQTKISSRTAD